MEELTPNTRYEKFLAAAAGNEQRPDPVTRDEKFLAALSGDYNAPEPVTRDEKMLAYAAGNHDAITPNTRHEKFVAALSGDVEAPDPITREEKFWNEIAKNAEKTLTGDVVSFVGKSSTEILSLTAAITPVQVGSGDPSPSNVRPITGYTGANIYVSPTQNQGDATVYNVDWTSAAGTVYGGTLDVLTGKLTVTHVGIDMGSVDYTMNTTHKFAAFFPTGTNAMVEFNSSDEVAPIMCSAYKVSTYTNTWTNVNDGICAYVAGGGQEKFGVIDHNYSDKDSFKTAVTGQKIVYPLKTAKTYNLTAQQVAALVGQNYIWADTGDVTVTVKGAKTSA